MTPLSPTTRSKVELFSLLGALSVCLLHVPWPTGSEAAILFLGLRDTICPLALPFFFIFSGYFLARHVADEGWWRRAVTKRIFSLGVPYVIWLLAFLLVMFAICRDRSFLNGAGLIATLGFNPCRPPRLYPFWFLRCLFFFVLISPLVVKAIVRGQGLLLMGIIYTLDLVYAVLLGTHVVGPDTTRLGGLFWYGFHLDGFFYFIFGIYAAIRPLAAPRARTVRLCGLIGAVLVVLRLLSVHFNCWQFIYPNIVLAPPLLVYFWYTIPAVQLPAFLHGTMFPIYLMHYFVIEAYCHYRGWSHLRLPECALIAALALALPILAAQILRRLFPRLATILFGGR